MCCLKLGVSIKEFVLNAVIDFEKDTIKHLILDFVRLERALSPRIGGYKLFLMAKAQFKEDFRMGRDAFYSLLDQYNLKLRQKKRSIRTTDSTHNYKKYPNIIKSIILTKCNQVWVSDITYIRTSTGFIYLSLITDLYSRRRRFKARNRSLCRRPRGSA